MQFYIKNFDENICKVELYRTELTGEFNCRVIDIYNQSLCSALIGEDIASWVLRRKPYLRRKNIEQLLAKVGITNIEEYFCLTFGLSLTDTLWLCPTNTNLLWRNINLYENKFNKYISNFAFSGDGGVSRSTSPEFSTNGALPKCWRRINDEIYLYKGGSEGYANAGREPFSEFYATQLLEAIQMIDYVPYTCKIYHNKLVSICKIFTSIDYGFVPQRDIESPRTFEELFMQMKNTPYWDNFRKMLIFDALIVNDDRHLGNYGYLRNNHTGEIEKFAPIFDNGCGCLAYYMPDKKFSVSDIKKYIDAKMMSSGADFIVVAKNCLDDEMKGVLRNLQSFKFKAHNLDSQDIEILDVMLQYQIKRILRC